MGEPLPALKQITSILQESSPNMETVAIPNAEAEVFDKWSTAIKLLPINGTKTSKPKMVVKWQPPQKGWVKLKLQQGLQW